MNEESSSTSSPKRKHPLLKRLLLGFFILILGGFLLLLGAKAVTDYRYFEGYDSSLPLSAQVLEKSELDSGIREKLTFQATEGPAIPAVFHYPKSATEPVACLVLLYGIGQKMGFADDIANLYTESGYALFCPEQLGQGERKPKEKESGLSALQRLRNRGRLTVLEARRCVDYLETRPEIDPDRTILFGVSLGAILGSSALAFEPRFEAGILMWGGGNFKLLFQGNRGPNEDLGPLGRLLAWFGGFYLKPVDPILRIDTISPRPLLFQNALQDEIIPKVATEAYFEAAGDPKEILWYECGHEKGLTEELIHKILKDQVDWLDRTLPEMP